MGDRLWGRWLLAPAVLLVGMALGASTAPPVRSQGPTCPTGFVFDRNSGVGCVQEDCGSVASAKYSYTGACICEEGYKACYEPVDYSGFDREQCGPFCPLSRLVACVAADARRPGEEPPATEVPTAAETTVAPIATAQPASGETGSDSEEDDLLQALLDALFGGDGTDPLEALLRVLAGGSVSAPTPGKAAAAGAAAGAGLAVWLFAEALMKLLTRPGAPATTGPGGSLPPGPAPATTMAPAPAGPLVQRIYDGKDAEKILGNLNILPDLRRLKRDDPQYWEKMDKALEKVKSNRRVKAITYQQGPGGIDVDSLVIVVEEPECAPIAPTPPAPASAPPPPLPPVLASAPPPPPVAPPTSTKPARPKPPAATMPPTPGPVAPPSPPPTPPPVGASASASAGVSSSPPGPHTFQDGTPAEQQEIRDATKQGLAQVNAAIATLTDAKTKPSHYVQVYLGIKGTTPQDVAQLDALIAKFRVVQAQIVKGVPFEVDTYGPLTVDPRKWWKNGSVFEPAPGYVRWYPGYGYGNVHIVYPQWQGYNLADRAKVVVHELTHRCLDAKDHAGSWQPSFQRLTPAQVQENADSLATFAKCAAQRARRQ